MITFVQRTLWASLLAGAALTASAQTPAAPSFSADPAQRMERMAQRRAAWQAEFKNKLQLSAAQDGAWTQYQAALKPPANATTALHTRQAWAERRAEFARLSTPERLDRMQARHAEHNARFTQRTEATRSFYAQLNPAQQKTFDAETLKLHARAHRFMRGQHRHGEGGASVKG